MRKPKKMLLMDSWHTEPHGHAHITSKVHKGDHGWCLSLQMEEDVETNDIWLNLKDAKILLEALQSQVKYLEKLEGEEHGKQ